MDGLIAFKCILIFQISFGREVLPVEHGKARIMVKHGRLHVMTSFQWAFQILQCLGTIRISSISQQVMMMPAPHIQLVWLNLLMEVLHGIQLDLLGLHLKLNRFIDFWLIPKQPGSCMQLRVKVCK